MTVVCAGCGRELPKEYARPAEVNGEVVYYCSVECEVRARTAGRLAEEPEDTEVPEE